MQSVKRYLALVSILGTLALPVQSFAGSLDDFEDGNHDGWLSGNNGGISADGVESHNGSLMAYASHVGDGSAYSSTATANWLSQDIAYSAGEVLAFDMQGVATSASTCCTAFAHGKAGVTWTFTDIFHIPLGSAGLYYSTSSGILGAGEHLIDSVQHHYETTMASFAALAGLDAAAPIANMTLSFTAFGQFVGGGNIYPNARATAEVWFDNVAVGTVPEPASGMAMLLGLSLLAILGRRAHGR